MASEIVAVPEIAPVPWTRPWYRGLANVRGRLVGVIDLMQMTGREPLVAEQALQVLVLGESLAVNAGILITRAFGIRNLKDLTPLEPDATRARAEWEHARYRDIDGLALTELNLRELAGSSAFASIGI
jgi:twitching motility protein PilI